MTLVTDAGPSSREALLQAVRLALGITEGLDRVGDWEGVVRAAVAERCAPLAWVRCGREIARAAPPRATAAFRSYFAANAVRTSCMLTAAHEVAIDLQQVGASPIVLKGPPLAARLYGNSAARVCSDLDWYIPADRQLAVHDAMLRRGWAPIEGQPGGEVCYGRRSESGQIYIEVHSSLLHPRYSYLSLPAPLGTVMIIDQVPLLAQEDPLVAGYLSAHLATHRFAPLAWLVDLIELWDSLDASARIEARRAARDAGISRYLVWGLERGVLLRRAAQGDRRAAQRLGLREGWRVEAHPMWRHIALAPGLAGTARAAWTWIAPRWVTDDRATALRVTMRRVTQHWREALPSRHG